MNSEYEAIHEDAIGYERYMGRWSRASGRLLVDWLQTPRRQKWLDVGCGTGALTEVILADCDPTSIVAFDPSEPHVAFGRTRIKDRRADLRTGNALAIGASAGEFDISVAALVLNFIPDQKMAIAEMSRVVRPGGTVAITVWDWAGRRNISQHLWDAILDTSPSPALVRQDELRSETSRPDVIVEMLRQAGLGDIGTTSLDIEAKFQSFDDYWSAHIGFSSSPSIYCRSLPPDRLATVQIKLREILPADEDGKISYLARAWAFRGTVPDAQLTTETMTAFGPLADLPIGLPLGRLGGKADIAERSAL